DVHGHVLLAVVHGDRQADEVGDDRRAARPGLDRALVVAGAGLLHLGHQVMVHERPFLDGTSHGYFTLLSRTIMTWVRLFFRVLNPLACTPHGETGGWPAAVRPSPPPCGWSIGFIATPRTVGRTPRQRTRPALPIDSR